MSAPAWYLMERGTRRRLAGPFPQHADCGFADPPEDESWEDVDSLPVYGVLDDDGRVARRDSPQEKAFDAHLGEQLDRITTSAGRVPDDHLAFTIAEHLVGAGFELHDCAAKAPTGGVCLTPLTDPAGAVAVTWTQHDRTALQASQGFGPDWYAAVQKTMNATLAEVLRTLEFEVEPFGTGGAWMVVGG